MTTAILWFRRDLRLGDNPALHQALSCSDRLVPLYIHAPEEEAPWKPGAASNWWLHHSLKSLEQELRDRGSRLIIRSGSSSKILLALIKETKASRVFWELLYEPVILKRDQTILNDLKRRGIRADPIDSHLLVSPPGLLTASGTPFRVFGRFWNACREHEIPAPLPRPRRLPPPPTKLHSLTVEDLALSPPQRWPGKLAEAWTAGEHAAKKRLQDFCRDRLDGYPQTRDLPGIVGTSRLSPHLHFGEISPRQIHYELHRHLAQGGDHTAAQAFWRQIGWREFGHYLLCHFPFTTDSPLDERFGHFQWASDPRVLKAWQEGKTGYPIVDAGMRELWQTGWMHNRVRMIVASFLTKNLQIAWQEGARWFWDTLVDADLANNTLGWQWVAGCGADAAPYFRIFNPVLQSTRFDPDGVYLRRWLPELARLPDRWLYEPHRAPAATLASSGVRLGIDYPYPVVDLMGSRLQALKNWKRFRRTEG